MKTLLILLLLTSYSFGQEVIGVSRGNAWHAYHAVNATGFISEGHLFLYGGTVFNLTTKASGTRQVPIPYLRYKVVGAPNYDSVRAYTVNLVYPPGNVSYAWSQSIKYLTPTGYLWNAAPPDTIVVSTSQLTNNALVTSTGSPLYTSDGHKLYAKKE